MRRWKPISRNTAKARAHSCHLKSDPVSSSRVWHRPVPLLHLQLLPQSKGSHSIEKEVGRHFLRSRRQESLPRHHRHPTHRLSPPLCLRQLRRFQLHSRTRALALPSRTAQQRGGHAGGGISCVMPLVVSAHSWTTHGRRGVTAAELAHTTMRRLSP